MSSIYNRFSEIAMRHPDRVALQMREEGGARGLTFREVLNRSSAIGAYLTSAGVGKGDRVAIFSENRPELGIAYLGIVSIGAVAVPLDAQYTAEEVENLLRDSESRAIFTSASLLPTVQKACKGLKIAIVSLDDPLPPQSHAKGGGEEPTVEDPASLLYTSGTTGTPKGVVLTHGNLLSNADAIIKSGIVTGEDHILGILPLHHTYPFMVCFLVPLFSGGRTTYLNSLKGQDIIKTVREEGITVLVGVPQLFTLMRKSILERFNALPGLAGILARKLFIISRGIRRRTGINIGRVAFRRVHREFGDALRFFASGGARLEPAVAYDMEGIGFTIYEGYGLTETSPVATFNLPGRKRIGSVGRGIDRVEVRIDRPDPAGVGEVLIKGPNVMQGYYRNREATDEVIRDGWFHSGDLGRLDRDGFLYITGRSKEVIVLGSAKNIYPEDIENHYMQSPYIKEICVIGTPDRDHPGNIGGIKALVLPDYERLAADGIVNVNNHIRWQIEGLSASIPAYKRVSGVGILRGPLPRTHLGKIRRFMVRDEEADEGQPLQASSMTEKEKGLMDSDTGKAVIGAISSVTDKNVSVNSNLELDLGIDSLGRVEMIAALERGLGLSLPRSFSIKVVTVRDVISEASNYIDGSSLGEPIINGASWGEILRSPPSVNAPPEIKKGGGSLGDMALRFTLWVIFMIFRLFFRLEVRGAENIPAEGPCIITPNHVSLLDGFVIGSVLRKRLPRLYAVGFRGFFQGPLTSRLGRWSHVIIIDSDSGLSESLQASAAVLREGVALILFPEGGRSVDGRLLPFKKGVGILAKETEVPVIPVSIKGTYEVLPRGAVIPRLRKITVTFGRPVTPSNLQGLDYQEIADMLREQLVKLD